MVIKDNGAPLESLTVLPVVKSTNDRDNLIGTEKTGLNEPNGFKQNSNNYLLGLVIWCSCWTVRVIWIKTRFHHIAAVDSSLKINQ